MPKRLPNTRTCQRLNCEIEDLLRKKSAHSFSFITSIEQRIRQFRLEGVTQPHELINEAYLRALKVIERGESIENPKGWMRSTIFNIIREKSRERQKQQSTDPQSYILDGWLPGNEEHDQTEEQIPHLTLDQRWRLLEEALEDLINAKPELGKVMHWRLIQRLSWKEIQERLISENGKAPTETTLRKRASRSKRLLRKLYHQREEKMRNCLDKRVEQG